MSAPSGPITFEDARSTAGEDTLIGRIVADSLDLLDTGERPVRRGQHPKHHGCVRADFVIEPDLPPEWKLGLFREGRTIPALIRFSNGRSWDDRKGDIHGMAIKLLGVEGEKVLESERDAPTHDFVLADHPAFFIRDLAGYVTFSAAVSGARTSWLGKIAFVIKVLFSWNPPWKHLRAALGKKPDSPLRVRYWSQTPYRFDRSAVKYSARPDLTLVPPPPPPPSDSKDRLREAMSAHLSRDEARFDFLIQLQTDPVAMPINDPTVAWDEAKSPYRKVATIRIPRQEFDTPAAMEFCENLSFTPWHCLPLHCPLGAINRARRAVYEAVSGRRHELNRVPRREPSLEDVLLGPLAGEAVPPVARDAVGRIDQRNDSQGRRDTSRDGLANELEFFILTHFHGFWDLVQRIGSLRSSLNTLMINIAVLKIRPRPYALSTRFPYTSWESLTDRTYSSRHLPPVTRKEGDLPPVEDVVALFRRPKGLMKPSGKSTVLFPYFAQWFTDGFLRTSYVDPLKNTSNHDIDLSNLYGLRREFTEILRSHRDGKLRSQIINGEEYPAYYSEDGRPAGEFAGLSMTPLLPVFEQQLGRAPLDTALFATGGDRVNSQVGFLAMNVLFLREHNRICDVLGDEAGLRDDEQLFQVARNVLIVLLLKIVIEQYINHIAPYDFKFRLQPGCFERQRWYRQNWMAVEFNLLYRWHGLVPDSYRIAGRDVPLAETLYNNRLLIDHGLGALLEDASAQTAGRIGLFNTPEMLLETEKLSIELGRLARLASYNDYRELCKFPRVTDFDQISGDPTVQAALKDVYGHVDRVEYYPGIFAEDDRPDSALPALIGRLVGSDAFSQALTNPLLSANLYNERTFTAAGLKIIETTRDLSDILHRNLPAGSRRFHLSMDQPVRCS
jgi:prostaglandin-endoperoxide synthase 2